MSRAGSSSQGFEASVIGTRNPLDGVQMAISLPDFEKETTENGDNDITIPPEADQQLHDYIAALS
jgi:hypothetical protein